MRRVVITGIGALTPLGNSFSESWKALKAGESGIKEITRFDVSSLPWKLAGELTNFDPEIFLTKKEALRLDPFVQYAVAASMMAAEDARISNSGFSNYTGIIIGSSRGGITTIEREFRRHKLSSYLMPTTTVSMAASYVAQKLGIQGYCLGISTACASGASALGEAYRLISSGILKAALAGGSEAPICKFCLKGYGAAGALSKMTSETPRPFDKERDGFVLAEGACILILEDFEEAMKRGAKVYGEIIGYGNTVDAYHMTRPSAKGEAKAIKKALRSAGLDPGNVDMINTHGTGTQIGDLVESDALRSVFGKRKIPAVAIKSMTGHMLAASGAFEVAVTLLSIQEKIIPPTINTSEIDDRCMIQIFKESKKANIDIAISNSFGFGGINTVLILRRPNI